MGEGKVPISQIMDVLKAAVYSGYLSFEWERAWHPEIPLCDIAFPQYVNYMGRYF
jgi:sugar phosphate isomerase/epimerase